MSGPPPPLLGRYPASAAASLARPARDGVRTAQWKVPGQDGRRLAAEVASSGSSPVSANCVS